MMNGTIFFSFFLFLLTTGKALPKGTLLHTEINIEGGKKLVLSDGSCWEVDPEDIASCSLWLSPFPVTVVFTGKGAYPYFLIRIQSEDKIRARPG